MPQATLESGTFSSKNTSQGECAPPENALLAAGTGLLIPQIQKLYYQAYLPTCCSFTSVNDNGCCHWEPSASSSRMFPFVLKKNSHFYCFILHSLTQCDSVIPPGFISWTPFARAWGKNGVTNELFCVAAGQRGGKG